MKIVILGAGGRLGAALMREWTEKGSLRGFNHTQLDLGEPNELKTRLEELEFDALLNAAALTNVDYCEDHREEAMQLNAAAPALLAQLCREKGARFLHVSTDYVFDGEKRAPYTEEDAARPISVYGESKREGERRVLAKNSDSLIIRVSWVFGPDRPSFIDAMLKKARTEKEISAVSDKFSTPSYTRDLAALIHPLLASKGPSGLMHLANAGACSWQEYAQWALDCCHRFGVPMAAERVGATSLGAMKNFVARRPVYTVLATEKYARLTSKGPRDWHEAVEEYVRNYYASAHTD